MGANPSSAAPSARPGVLAVAKVFVPAPAAIVLACALAIWWAGAARADTARTEIEALLVAVGQSGCAFVRNGEEHSPTDAEDHLRLKYRRGARYADTAEHFIERLASKSSWTGRPYTVRCPEAPEQPASTWLHGLLRAQREARDARSNPE